MGEGDEEVGKRRVVFRIMSGVVAVFVTAAGEQDGQVAPAVGGGVAEVGPKEDGGVVEQMTASFLHVLELGEKIAEHLELRRLDAGELLDLLLIATVVGEHVPIGSHARDVAGHGVEAADGEGDHARGIGLQRQQNEGVHHALLGEDVVAGGNLLRFLIVDLRLGTVGPFPVLLQTNFKLAY